MPRNKPLHCEECDAEFQPYETIYIWSNELMCRECCKSFVDDMDFDELAEKLDIEMQTAPDDFCLM